MKRHRIIITILGATLVTPAKFDFDAPDKRHNLFSAPQHSNSPDEEPQSQNREQIRDFQLQMSATSATTSISIPAFLTIPPKDSK